MEFPLYILINPSSGMQFLEIFKALGIKGKTGMDNLIRQRKSFDE